MDEILYLQPQTAVLSNNFGTVLAGKTITFCARNTSGEPLPLRLGQNGSYEFLIQPQQLLIHDGNTFEFGPFGDCACSDLKGTELGLYYKSTWRFRYPPNSQCSVFLKSYDPLTRKFGIIVLYDKRELQLSVGYPLIAINEEEAQLLAEKRRAADSNLPHKTKVMADTQKQQVAEDEGATTGVVSGNAGTTDVAPPDAPKKKGGAKRDPSKPSASSIIKEAIAQGLDKEEIARRVKAVFPDKDDKKLKSHIAVLYYAERAKKAAKSKG